MGEALGAFGLVTEVVEWFSDGEHWRGATGVPQRMVEHVLMSLAATLGAVIVGLPLGVALGHRRGRPWVSASVTTLTNLARAVPSYGVLVLFALAFGLSGWPGFGARPALVALFVLAVPPIVTNSYVGVRDVDADVREAARGMGMTGWQIVRRVEAPLAAPLMLAGIRTSAVQVVATATLAAATAWGGLGRFVVDGFRQRDEPQIVAGALLVAVLSLMTEIGLGFVQRWWAPGSRAGVPIELRPR